MYVSESVVRAFPRFAVLQEYFRRARVAKFIELLGISPSTRILDLGGEPYYWRGFPIGCSIVCVNIYVSHSDQENVTCVQYGGDVLPFDDRSFDVVHCNSVIEHVGDFSDQRRFAKEICRVGERYWVQVPNFYFPWEPHAFLPFYQFLSPKLKIMARRYWKKSPYTTGELLSIRLLTAKELTFLFPDAIIYRERFMGLTKSLCAYR